MLYKNRIDAALRLIPLVEKYKNENGVILAVPRGGIPLGFILAKHLKFPLDILLTKKIGHPQNKELAIGAVSMDDEIIDPRFDIPKAYLEHEIPKIRKSLKEKYIRYMGSRQPVSLNNKIVIIIDDGLATGNTILAVIRVIRKKHPAKIVVAVPVAPESAKKKLENYADDFLCPYTPKQFEGVGQFYEDFGQTEDAEVIRLLQEVNSPLNVPKN